MNQLHMNVGGLSDAQFWCVLLLAGVRRLGAAENGAVLPQKRISKPMQMWGSRGCFWRISNFSLTFGHSSGKQQQ